MKSALEFPKDSHAHSVQSECEDGNRGTVLRELDSILSSRHFKSADRCKQFLRYVVLSKLDDHTDRLKERTIGTEVFQRPPGYATGEDPVVRVQAGEVRRRLQQYYQETPQSSALRIELPLGSYSPVFHWGNSPENAETPTRPVAPDASAASRRKPRLRILGFATIGILAAFSAGGLYHFLRVSSETKPLLEQFWSPALASHEPILICVANATNGPSDVLSDPSSRADSQTSQPAAAGTSMAAPNSQSVRLTDEDPEKVPAADASVAVVLSGLFGKLDKPIQLRIGAASTFEDLRNSPAALIGGFNSRWTIQLDSNLHFIFAKVNGQYQIREQATGGRTWATRFGPHGETVEDFAIVGRLIDSKTGQFAVTIAGIGPRGTQAAGEFVSSSRYLKEGLGRAPADWPNRNLEVLLETTVTDSVAGPPHVIATYSW